MKFSLVQKRVLNFEYQRNLLLGITVCLLVSNVLLSVCVLLTKEKTIILPPEVRQEFWSEGNRFSPSYLEEQAAYMTHLALDVNESNIKSNMNILFRYVAPERYSHFREKCEKEYRKLKQNNASTRWSISEFTVFPERNAVEVKGALERYVGSKQISSVAQTYKVQFMVKQGRLFVLRIENINTKGKGEENEQVD